MTQNAPVQVSHSLISPYSTTLSDYTKSENNRILLNITLTDLTEPVYQSRLRITIEGTIDSVYVNDDGDIVVVTEDGQEETITGEEDKTTAIGDEDGNQYVVKDGAIIPVGGNAGGGTESLTIETERKSE